MKEMADNVGLPTPKFRGPYMRMFTLSLQSQVRDFIVSKKERCVKVWDDNLNNPRDEAFNVSCKDLPVYCQLKRAVSDLQEDPSDPAELCSRLNVLNELLDDARLNKAIAVSPAARKAIYDKKTKKIVLRSFWSAIGKTSGPKSAEAMITQVLKVLNKRGGKSCDSEVTISLTAALLRFLWRLEQASELHAQRVAGDGVERHPLSRNICRLLAQQLIKEARNMAIRLPFFRKNQKDRTDMNTFEATSRWLTSISHKLIESMNTSVEEKICVEFAEMKREINKWFWGDSELIMQESQTASAIRQEPWVFLCRFMWLARSPVVGPVLAERGRGEWDADKLLVACLKATYLNEVGFPVMGEVQAWTSPRKGNDDAKLRAIVLTWLTLSANGPLPADEVINSALAVCITPSLAFLADFQSMWRKLVDEQDKEASDCKTTDVDYEQWCKLLQVLQGFAQVPACIARAEIARLKAELERQKASAADSPAGSARAPAPSVLPGAPSVLPPASAISPPTSAISLAGS